MLWYRRPIQPRPDTIALNRVRESFLFAHCVHVTGSICLTDETNLCKVCYSRLRTNIIRQEYRSMQRHFFVNSHIVRKDYCSSCSTTVIKIKSLDECISCTLTACEFLDLLYSTSTPVNNYDYPLVLNVYDRTPRRHNQYNQKSSFKN